MAENLLEPHLRRLLKGIRDTSSDAVEFGGGLLDRFNQGQADFGPSPLTQSSGNTGAPSLLDRVQSALPDLPQGPPGTTFEGNASPPLIDFQGIGDNLTRSKDAVVDFLGPIADIPGSQTPGIKPEGNQVPVANTPEDLVGIVQQVNASDKPEEDKKAAVAEVTENSSDAIAANTRSELTASGATEEELSGWDKFADEYDIATIGMALLASNDGKGTFSANFGKAMMAGKAAKTNQAEKKEARADKKTAQQIAIENARSTRMAAEARQFAAKASISGVPIPAKNLTVEAGLKTALNKRGSDLDYSDDKVSAWVTQVAGQAQQAMQMREANTGYVGMSNDEIYQGLLDNSEALVPDTTFGMEFFARGDKLDF
jgi:hypothetical protein